MRHLLQHIFHAAFLAFALILAGVLAAVAEGKMAADQRGVTTMVICAGEGPATVAFDSSGNPVAPSDPAKCEFCPACIFNCVAMQSLSTSWERPERLAFQLTPRIPAVQYSGPTALWRYARGPPNEA
ncbi:hypothetical protein FDP25_10035 [Roseovarius sp. A21]|uniref:DUF2946 domain-containing protein n=1 Tax=Roseovarius bejariae TaxID=2576383 RepID=A0A844D0K1_9RHOB|nr:hypothetical protein [Roseovarius bejariae]MRU15764.1 hypothetical protein [Roseovarius bejariae]